jgi:ATP-dependent DNA helicase 2 subunit 1
MIFSKATGASGRGLKPRDHKQIVVYTNNDDPSFRDDTAREQCVKKARDCQELGHKVLLQPMKNASGTGDGGDGDGDGDGGGETKEGGNAGSAGSAGGARSNAFDRTKFYREIMPIADPDADEEDNEEAAAATLDDLLTKARRRYHTKRTQARLPFVLGEGVEIALQLFIMLGKAVKGSPTWLEARTNDTLKCTTRWLCNETGDYLQPHQIRSWTPVGKSRVPMSKDDMATIKTYGDPGLQLLGFRPIADLSRYGNVRNPYFVYPDETALVGSRTAFAALHAQMLAKKQGAVCCLVTREASAPKLVAVLPQESEFDENGFECEYAGMHVIVLPFAEDIRPDPRRPPAPADADAGEGKEGEEGGHTWATKEQVNLAKTFVKGLDLPNFEPSEFSNPALQKHYANLQALALQADGVEWDDEMDTVVADNAALGGIDKEHGIISNFVKSYGGDREPEVKVKGGKKRAAAGEGEDGAKRVKAEPVAARPDKEVEEMIAQGTLKKLTVPALKAILKGKGQSTGGKKADLVERIEASFGGT